VMMLTFAAGIDAAEGGAVNDHGLLMKKSVRELKFILRDLQVSADGVLEKRDLVNKILEVFLTLCRTLRRLTST